VSQATQLVILLILSINRVVESVHDALAIILLIYFHSVDLGIQGNGRLCDRRLSDVSISMVTVRVCRRNVWRSIDLRQVYGSNLYVIV